MGSRVLSQATDPGTPSSYCVTMCEFLNISELEFAYQENGTYLLGLLKEPTGM